MVLLKIITIFFYGIHEENVNKSYLNYIEQSENFDICKIVMNGIDRIPFKKSTYFRTIQPYESNMRTFLNQYICIHFL